MEMDYLRWILLAAAIIIIAVIYFFSHARKKDRYEMPLDEKDEVPSFSAKDVVIDNEWMHGVGPVRVVSNARTKAEDEIRPNKDEMPKIDLSETEIKPVTVKDTKKSQETKLPEQALPKENHKEEIHIEKSEEVPPADSAPAEEPDVAIDDVISVYVLAHPEETIKGEKILSASYALHLDFGDMKIFHRHSETPAREIQFSMASIQEPGWFEIDSMNDMQTMGVSFFMQVNLVNHASAVLDEMLICAHSLSTMLGATLCNAQRKPLDEASTIELREKVKRLEKIKSQSV
jgi:cell division protein ZipA